jgi:deazaflavin-dependent oxidoreductase (nitroreductase family)
MRHRMAIVGKMATEYKDWNNKLMEEFRANGGKVTGQFEGAPLLLLTTTGAKSGRPYTTPVMYLPDGDLVVVFASKGGAPTNPDWYHNLLANPHVTVEVGTDSYEADAKVLTGEERDRLYARQAEAYPGFAEYQEKTQRVIPVVALHRVK